MFWYGARRGRSGSLAALLLVATLAGSFGCATRRTVRTPVFAQGGVRVFLRETHEGGEALARDFSHPTVIAPIRVARIVGSLDVRERGSENDGRRAAVPTELVTPIGTGVAEALGQAGPNQEVVVMAVSRKRRMGIFTSDYLTSMVLWVMGDELWIHFGDLESRLSSDPTDKAPEPQLSRASTRFRVLPGEAVRVAGGQTVAAAWRDDRFAKSGPIRTRPGGRVLRRTILMESEVEPSPPRGVGSEDGGETTAGEESDSR